MPKLSCENARDLAREFAEGGFLPLGYASHVRCLDCGEDSEMPSPVQSWEDISPCRYCDSYNTNPFAILEVDRQFADDAGWGEYVEGFGTKSCPYRIAVECQ